jgi:hypothetical protein
LFKYDLVQAVAVVVVLVVVVVVVVPLTKSIFNLAKTKK